jgi:hypothetical protein
MKKSILFFLLLIPKISVADVESLPIGWSVPAKEDVFLDAAIEGKKCPTGGYTSTAVCTKFYRESADIQIKARSKVGGLQAKGDFDCDGNQDTALFAVGTESKEFGILVLWGHSSQVRSPSIVFRDRNQKSREFNLHFGALDVVSSKDLISNECEIKRAQCEKAAFLSGADCGNGFSECKSSHSENQNVKCDMIRWYRIGQVVGDVRTGEATPFSEGSDSIFYWNGQKFLQSFEYGKYGK